jgi:transcriptional regulator with XRE-family HTH domain
MQEPNSLRAKVQAEGRITLRDLVRPRASAQEVARVAGVSVSLIYKVGAGARKPNAQIRRAVEEVFGVPARFVFGEVAARRWRRT